MTYTAVAEKGSGLRGSGGWGGEGGGEREEAGALQSNGGMLITTLSVVSNKNAVLAKAARFLSRFGLAVRR